MVHATCPRAFTLIEVLIATVLIGVAIAALVAANSTFSLANASGADLSTGEFLIEQIRELTVQLPVADPALSTGTAVTVLGRESGETTLAACDDVDDFDGFDSATVGAPIDARRATLPALAAYRQVITVQKVNPSNFDETLADTAPSDFVRITVQIFDNGHPLCSASWIRARF